MINTKKKQENGLQPADSTDKASVAPASDEQDTAQQGSKKLNDVVYGTQNYPGRNGIINKHSLAEADTALKLYKQGKKAYEEKIIENEAWWRLRHWDVVKKAKGKEDYEQPASAWLFNSLANRHADFMDNFPEPNFLPREESDQEDAEMLQRIVPCILESNGFEQVYNDASWYKLKQGTSCYGVFWNASKENGLGDIDIKQIDLKNLYWEPGITDLQASQYMFNLARVDVKTLETAYPFLKGDVEGNIDSTYTTYAQDENDTDKNVNDSDKVTVVDWYYKKQNSSGKTIVHYVKYVDDMVLYASENDERYKESGYYDHGMYPFVFDVMFPIESGPVGFGMLDVMKNPQLYIDKLDQIILRNAAMSGQKRWFIKQGCTVDEKAFADFSNPFVTYTGGQIEDNLKEIQVSPVPNFIVNHLQLKVDELKETSGNRDFSQGSTQSGVTAASAIAALQEAGSKLSRDMIKSSYRAFEQVCTLSTELIRQFYTEQRSFRIDKPDGGYQFVEYSNATITDQNIIDPVNGEPLSRRPVFDIRISAQKQSPFSRTAQNETAKELFNMGAFNPTLATQVMPMLEMMDFEGIENIKKTVSQNGTLLQTVQQLQQLSLQMAQTIDQQTGGQMGLTQQIAGIIQQATGQQVQTQPQQGDAQGSGNGGLPKTDNTIATKARTKAAQAATPEGSRK